PLEKQANRDQTKALSSENGQSRAGAEISESLQSAHSEAQSSTRVQNSTTFGGSRVGDQTGLARSVRDATDAVRSAHSVQNEIAKVLSPNMSDDMSLDVPNIEPSPLPEGQVIFPDGILF